METKTTAIGELHRQLRWSPPSLDCGGRGDHADELAESYGGMALSKPLGAFQLCTARRRPVRWGRDVQPDAGR